MVNNNSIKIISILSKAKDPVSGEEMGKLLGISRTAVWKQINTLKEKGFPAESTPKGYLLKEECIDPDRLKADELLHYYTYSASSTMQFAEKFINTGKDSVCIADFQSAGKGRAGKEWISAPGGIYCTFLLYDRVPLKLVYRYVLAGGIAVTDLLEKIGINAQIKWPNDILVNGKKISGILVESKGELDRCDYIKLGIGININNSNLPENAVSAFKIIKDKFDRTSLILLLEKKLLNYREYIFKEKLVDIIREKSCTIGREIKIVQNNKVIFGKAMDIDSEGNLILENKKSLHRISYGDCYHLS